MRLYIYISTPGVVVFFGEVVFVLLAFLLDSKKILGNDLQHVSSLNG